MSGAPALPPTKVIDAKSSLLAVAPPVLESDEAGIGAAPPASHFGTEDLAHALVRSQQTTTPKNGMRRATSAPHSMDSLASSSSAEHDGGTTFLPPSGGPMRRVASSLGMRRSSSFFWTPSAHHDFEQAVEALSGHGRGDSVTSAAILQRMRHHPDLKLQDVEKHMQKKRIVTNRLLMQLQNRTPLSPPDSPASPIASPRSPMSPGPKWPAGGAHFATALPHGGSSPSGSFRLSTARTDMEPVAEEPTLLVAAAPTARSLAEQVEAQHEALHNLKVMHAQMQSDAVGGSLAEPPGVLAQGAPVEVSSPPLSRAPPPAID